MYTLNCCQLLETGKHRSALFAHFLAFAFLCITFLQCEQCSWVKAGLCIRSQTHEEFPKHPQAEAGTEAASLEPQE